MKTIFATILAAAFLLSQPAFAGDEAPKDKKAEKKDGKKEEKKEEKKAEKGGW
jgi:hypothetical protein